MSNIINQFKQLVDFLGSILGENCEISLVDLQNNNNEIVAISNGKVNNRKLNSQIINFAQSIIDNEEWKNKDYIVNYKLINKRNRILRSSIFFIKNKDTLIGMLCINIDDSKYVELSNKILELAGTITNSEIKLNRNEIKLKHFADNIEDSIEYYISQTELSNISGDRLTQNEKKYIVEYLFNKGIFNIRGAVYAVSVRLSCSEPSVYRYLTEVHKNVCS